MASILMVAGEGLPFIKTGGLADVIGSLPAALADIGHEVKVVMPLYKKIADKYMNDLYFCKEYSVQMNYHEVPVRVFSKMEGNDCFFFIQHQGYFERDTLYGYQDDGERFAYFQKAVIEMLNQLNYWPNIIHCHDWHTGMIPCMVKETHSYDARYVRIKFVFTIHNMAYQGNFGPDMLDSCLGLPSYLMDNGNVKFDGGISFMKSALLYSDKVTTVSPTYSQEILTPQYGERLEAMLNMRKYDLWGIVNGIDINSWNPATDPDIPYHFNKVNIKSQKAKDKAALQRELGLEENPNVLLVGSVSRLTWQKGFYLLMEQLQNLANAPIQLAILGTGETKIEEAFRDLENNNKGKICFYKGYNEALAHRIYAGSDLFLMPSLFEPCGISQLCSMRYGTLPLVRETGGLKDTVTPYNEYDKSGNGFSFEKYNANDLMNTLGYAADVYYNRKADWDTLVNNALNTDVSWANSAKTYSLLYNELVG
jgi:starch synthase